IFMSAVIPYPTNLLEKPDTCRSFPEGDDHVPLYALFIKNLIPALVYPDFFKVELAGIYQVEENDQPTFYRLYQKGYLKIVDFDGLLISPLRRFQTLEFHSLKHLKIPEAQAYIEFLNRYNKIFICIDSLVEYKSNNKKVNIGNYIYK